MPGVCAARLFRKYISFGRPVTHCLHARIRGSTIRAGYASVQLRRAYFSLGHPGLVCGFVVAWAGIVDCCFHTNYVNGENWKLAYRRRRRRAGHQMHFQADF